MKWACLYDSDFNPLGNWTQHLVSEWSLTKRAYEFDDLTLTCQGFENSKHACFIGLHNETGALEYVAFCGIPTTQNGLTTIKGIDCRQLFNQEIKLDFSILSETTGGYQINSVKSLYQYLLKDCLASLNLGIDYGDPDLRDLDNVPPDAWKEENISRSAKVQSLYDAIQAANNLYDCVVLVVPGVDYSTNKYTLGFAVRRITNLINIKLSDYDVKMSLSQNIINRVICTDDTSTRTYYLYNDNTIGTEYDAEKVLMPPRYQTIEKDQADYEDDPTQALKDACTEGLDILYDNRYKDKVSIDLHTKLGSTLQDVDFSYFANITEYNPADPDSSKTLPVLSIKEDSKGNKKIEFGRLSDYWFMERN